MKKHLLILTAFLMAGTLGAQKINTTLTYSVVQAPEKTKEYPLFIVMHGYGSNENDLFELAKQLNPKGTVATLRAPIALGGDGYCWFQIERFPNKQIKYNYAQAEQSRKLIVDFIRQCCKVYKTDSSKVYLLGFSQGAIMSYDILLKSNFKVKGIMALSGRLMNESSQQTNTLLPTTKLFIAHGTQDEILDFSEFTKLSNYFTPKYSKQVTFKTYAMPHTISNEEVADIKNWLTTMQ